jgi:hypothetical protein
MADAEVFFNEVDQAAGGAAGNAGVGHPQSQRDQLLSMQADLASIWRMLEERNARDDERYLQLSPGKCRAKYSTLLSELPGSKMMISPHQAMQIETIPPIGAL